MDSNNTQAVPQGNNPVPPYQPQVAQPEHKKVGPIVAILVIVLILVIAAVYLFASRSNRPGVTPLNTDTADATEVQPVTNESDDVSALQADLDASVSGLDNQNF